jgi:hypothetical protein
MPTNTITKMNPEVKALWVDALRDGTRKQGHGQLRKDDNFCCLGVLSELGYEAGICERFQNEVIDVDDNGVETKHIEYRYGRQRASAFLPQEVMEWAGIKSDNGLFNNTENGDHNSLVFLNDSLELDFLGISNHVEKFF